MNSLARYQDTLFFILLIVLLLSSAGSFRLASFNTHLSHPLKVQRSGAGSEDGGLILHRR